MTRIKICGITNLDDAKAAVEFGADALGFIFFEKSPRYITPGNAAKIIVSLPPFVTTVGVFVNAHKEDLLLQRGVSGVDIAQLHGDEPEEYCKDIPFRIIKAIRVKNRESIQDMKKYSVNSFLLDTYKKDTYGGTGASFDWSLAVEGKKTGPIILSGGLTPETTYAAITTVSPYGVDVSSGVELEPGTKDHKKLYTFIKEVRRADNAA